MLAELTEVRKQYGNFQLNCTMQLEEGRITGLIGKNGAGKSTAFKAILGLIHVDDGTVRIMGQSGLWDSTVPDLRLHRKRKSGSCFPTVLSADI